MPKIDDLRKSPDFAGLSDEAIVHSIATEFPGVPTEKIRADLGLPPPPAPPKPGRTFGDVVGDVGITALRGAIGLPEAAVGIADIATGGRAGKALEGLGFRPKEAKDMLAEHYSEPQKDAFRAVEAAEGILPTLGAALSNPSVIGHSVLESLPAMGAGGVIGRGVVGLGAKVAPVGPALPGVLTRIVGGNPRTAAAVGGALGEGAMMAGAAAEQIRQQTPDGLLTGEQSGLAAATGVLGAGLSMVGAKVAKQLGLVDIDTAIVAGKLNAEAGKNLVKRVLQGAVAEGALEELPQSIMEQVLQNQALNKPLDEGVDHAAVLGFLAGATMGGGANAMSAFASPEPTVPPPSPIPGIGLPATQPGQPAPPAPVVPPAGPLESAAMVAGLGPAAPLTPGAPAEKAAAVGEAINTLVTDKPEEPDPFETAKQDIRLATRTEEEIAAEDAQWERDAAIYEDVTGAPPGGLAQDADVPFDEPGRPVTEEDFGLTAVDLAARETHASPTNDKSATDKQILAGNAPLGHAKVAGLDVSIENDDGSERVDKGNVPPKWRTQLKGVHYGYFRGSTAADSTPDKKQGVDVFLRAGTPPEYDGPVFIVDQIHQDSGDFDEHKVMLGFANRGAAVNAYRRQYSEGWKLGRITEMPMADFKAWVKDPAKTAKPASPKGPLNAPKSTTGLVEVWEGADPAAQLYEGLFESLTKGKSTYAGVKDPALARAKPAFDAGLIKSADDIRRFENEGYPNATPADPQAGAQAPAQGEPAAAPAADATAAGPAPVEAGGVGRAGYDTPVEVDARALKAMLEATRGEPLAEKPAKLDALRNGAKPSGNIELAFRDRDGRLDVNDGRHRIALAAESGATVSAFIDGKDAQRLREVLENNDAQAQTPADAGSEPTGAPVRADVPVQQGDEPGRVESADVPAPAQAAAPANAPKDTPAPAAVAAPAKSAKDYTGRVWIGTDGKKRRVLSYQGGDTVTVATVGKEVTEQMTVPQVQAAIDAASAPAPVAPEGFRDPTREEQGQGALAALDLPGGATLLIDRDRSNGAYLSVPDPQGGRTVKWVVRKGDKRSNVLYRHNLKDWPDSIPQALREPLLDYVDAAHDAPPSDRTETPAMTAAREALMAAVEAPAPKASAAVEDAGAWWTRATEDERRAVIALTAAKPKTLERLPRTAWADLSPTWQKIIAAKREPVADQKPAEVSDKPDSVQETSDKPADGWTDARLHRGDNLPDAVAMVQTMEKRDPSRQFRVQRDGDAFYVASRPKPVTPQVPNEPGTKYVLPSFVTGQQTKPAGEKVHRNMGAAEDALREAGKDTHEIVRVPKGLVVRPKAGAAPAPALTDDTAKRKARAEALTALRKRVAVLKSLHACVRS